MRLINIEYSNRALKRVTRITFGVTFLLFLFSCGQNSSQTSSANEPTKEAEEESIGDYNSVAAYKADSILNTLTIEEMAGQCFMPAIDASKNKYNSENLAHLIDDYHIGGIVVMSGDKQSLQEITDVIRRSKIPLFVAIDAEWGLGMRLEGASLYPRNGEIPLDIDENIIYDYGREIAREGREIGINMILGPVIDISSRKQGVIGSRSFGNDAKKVADRGVAYAKGLESGGVVSVAKHFPGHGSAINDSHIVAGYTDRSISRLDTVDLYPFMKYVKSGLNGIMAGHIQVPSLDPTRTPASVSSPMLNNLLREEMGFKGLVITDAFNMGGIKGYTGKDAVKAGADIILSPENLGKEMKALTAAIYSGEIEPEIIRERSRRIIFIKVLFGLFEKDGKAEEIKAESKTDDLRDKLLGNQGNNGINS